MILKVTDEQSLEGSGNDFKTIGDVTRESTRGALSRRAGHFVESVLDVNPDATEQIDRLDKHLTCAETIGAKARDGLKALDEAIDTQSAVLAGLFSDSGPDDLRRLLSDLARLAVRLSPVNRPLPTGIQARLRERLPAGTTPLRRYFQEIEALRPEAEKHLKTIDRILSRQQAAALLIVDHMEHVQHLSQTLGRAIRLGQLIDQTLCEALVYEVPRDDPREHFISGVLLTRLRNRLQALTRQMDLNRRHLITLELLIQNSRELAYGLHRLREALIGVFERCADLCLRLTRKRIVTLPPGWTRSGAEAEDGRAPAPPLSPAHISRDLARLTSWVDALNTFRAEGGPIIENTLSRLDELRRLTDEAFDQTRSYPRSP
ncbi:hypothetical protein JCM14469_23220 [Desulfatiferula olefinivorans]